MTHAPPDSHGENARPDGLARRETDATALQPDRQSRSDLRKPPVAGVHRRLKLAAYEKSGLAGVPRLDGLVPDGGDLIRGAPVALQMLADRVGVRQ
jgi:hypothetical protein